VTIIFGVELSIDQCISICVAIATFFLAIATFLTVWEMRKEKKENVIVEVKEGRASKLLIDVRKDEFPKYKDAPTIIITAINKGHRVVMLREVEIWIENIEKLNLKNIQPEVHAYEKGKPIYLTLPIYLNAGGDSSFRVYCEDISRALTRKGYSGEQKLIALLRSAINHEFRSQPFWLNIDRYRSEEVLGCPSIEDFPADE